ncbi:MAG TPA: hypothetical protein VK771_04925 [Acidimicrobiia bacterium]|nr:hypothetical protein [Acidimicrobiia bacterium]
MIDEPPRHGPDSLTASQISALGIGPITTSPAIKIGGPTAPSHAAASTQPGSLLIRLSAVSGNGTPVPSYLAVCVSPNGGVTRSAA